VLHTCTCSVLQFYWLRHHATSQKVTGSRLDEVNDFFFNLPNPLAALGPGVRSTSNRNEKQKNSVSGE
jgi:hypothetical protein